MVVAIATSLLLGNIILPTGPVLAEKTENTFDRDGDPASVGREFDPGLPIENCFWKTTLSADPYHNAFYPDAHSAYPVALFSLPENSHVEITGKFPHARSMTFSAYFYDPDSDTLVSGDHQIVDYEIEPDEGSTNPFRNGRNRTANDRSYTMTWKAENLPTFKQRFAEAFPNWGEKLQQIPENSPDFKEALVKVLPKLVEKLPKIPEDLPEFEELFSDAFPDKAEQLKLEPNTLYLGEKEFPNIGYIVVMRLYVPDKGTNLLGDTELPEAKIIRENGRVIEGDALCRNKYSKFKGSMGSVYPSPAFDPVAYKAERDRTEWYNQDRPDSWPAQDPPYIIREWTAKYNFCANFEQGPDNADQCPQPTDPNVGSGGFINSTTVYLTTWMDRNFGEILVLRGKKPKTPKTYFGNKIFNPTRDAEMRYFSWSTDEPLSRSRVIDSVFDEEMPVDENGYYTVVVSRPSYRPKNANYECGYAWLEFPAAGDGFGDMYLGELRNRWQMQMNEFEYAPQKTKIPGDEPEVMGEYFPQGTYYKTPEQFDEAFPCKS
ncbi:MAG: hypothetical protein F6K25_01570 [Okeania sp. SIO2G4]|uniref:hypothetical protein n=1 Tax=Okeania sp. SIO2G5 TaxID=2607796 RepID=UPI0013CD2BDB|nr:hypothetical protein [Okeania sp. SIO2G5]NEQ89508.1 hypothetical protein [Okeania sp. SIO2G4]